MCDDLYQFLCYVINDVDPVSVDLFVICVRSQMTLSFLVSSSLEYGYK